MVPWVVALLPERHAVFFGFDFSRAASAATAVELLSSLAPAVVDTVEAN